MTGHNGGVEAKRGFEFETQSLLNYLLLRMLEVKDNINITFEKQQDATIIYQATSARPAIIEIVQCKKREKPLPDSDPSVTLDGYDPWFLGPCGQTQLDEWLRSPTGGLSIMKQLDDSSHRYTVLLFGRPLSRLQRFVPNGLGPNWRGLDYLQIRYACPVHFEHATDPDKRRHFGPPHAVKRIRILPMAGPRLLEFQSRAILEDLQTRPHACHDIVKKLLDRVRELQLPKYESNRRFSSDEAAQFLIPGRFGMGRWQPGSEILARRSMLAGPGPDQPTDMDILSAGNIWENHYFKQATDNLFTDHALVITGPVVSGKTTLCKYLMHKFQSAFPNSATYYLDVRPEDFLEEELKFFEQHLNLPTLFVVDNEHFAKEPVAHLVNAFHSNSGKAYLVVTSIHTYSRTQASRAANPLNELPSITIENFVSAELGDLLGAGLQGLDGLAPEQRELAANLGEATGGKIGTTLVFARCFQGQPNRPADDRVLDTTYAKREIRQWLDRNLTITRFGDFDERVMPILLLVSYGMSIPTIYDPEYIERLCRLEILGPLSDEEPPDSRVIAHDLSIPLVVQKQYRRDTQRVIRDFLLQYPRDLYRVSAALVVSQAGRAVLRDLMSDPDLNLIPQLRDDLSRDPAGLAITFDAMRRATPDHARRLLRDLAAPHGQIDRTFVKELFEFHGTLATTMRLLGTFNKLDRGLVKDIFRSVVGTHQLNGRADHIIDSLIAVIEAPSVGLSETLAFIDLIRRCHHELGKVLFDSFISRSTYRQKKQMLIDAIGSVAEAIQCCRPLRLLSPKHFTTFVNEFLLQDNIETALVHMANTRGAFRLLRQLRTVHPRLAVTVLWKLWRTRPDWCKTTMMRSADIVDAVGLLLAVASIDRRIAIEFGHSYEDFLCRLVEAESDQFLWYPHK